MLALLMALTATWAGDFDPLTGYRTGHYRGIIRQAPEAVMRVDAPTAKRLWVEKRGSSSI